jgi:hypothetical protein
MGIAEATDYTKALVSAPATEVRNYVEQPFETFEKVEGMKPCMKLPIIVSYKRMNSAFRVHSLEGNFKYGKVGDVLMKGLDGENYICDGDIFDRTYGYVVNGSLYHAGTNALVEGITVPKT